MPWVLLLNASHTRLVEQVRTFIETRHPHLLPLKDDRYCSWEEVLPIPRKGIEAHMLEIGGFPTNRAAKKSAPGRVRFEIVPAGSGQVEVAVTQTCDSPAVTAFVEGMLEDIARRWPGALVRREEAEPRANGDGSPGSRRGGPAGTPHDQKREIVAGWLKVQGRMNQEVYAYGKGIAASTLRRWIRELRELGEL